MQATVSPQADPTYQALLDKQPYEVTLDGLRLEVHRDVFPPDLGQCARNLARLAIGYAPRRALDMGCGTGFIALSLKRAGAADVWASDIHGPAVENARRNVALNPQAGPVTVVQSDLFSAIDTAARFDVIVFNQPFGPGREVRRCGCGPDGGAAICRRFLHAAPAFLAPGGVVMMAFSDRQPDEHDPRHAGRELGFTVETVLDAAYGGARNVIYAMRPGGGGA